MRLMCAAAVSLVLGLFLSFADEAKPGDEKDRAAKFAALKKRAADNPSSQQAIRAEAREECIITAQKALEIIADDPTDATGLEVLAFVVEWTGRFGGGKELDTAAGLIAEHHLNNPKVKELLPMVSGGGEGAQKLLK